MMETDESGRAGGAWVWLGVGAFAFTLALLLSWAMQRRIDGLLDRVDTRTLDESAEMLDHILARQQSQLASLIGVLADDSRIRAMVLTPTFDPPTVLDLLTGIEATSGASVVALLDSGGTVRAVVGAPEMDQLDLGTSSLVRSALEKPSAQLWAFGNEAGVLSAAPVRLDNQVRALFMIGFEIGDALLQDIERALGATGAIFVGDRMVASATRDPELERALRSAAELPAGSHGVIGGRFLGSSSRVSDAAAPATVAWLVPRYRYADEVTLTRALSWLPAALVGLALAASLIGLVSSQRRAKQYLSH